MDPFHIAMEEHVHPPFELTQWSNNYSQIYQNHHESSNLLGLNHRSENFKVQEDQQEEEEPEEELGAIKEMMFKIAALQPVDIDPATVRKPKRRNLRISDDPQSIAARHRRERISEKIRILQRLVPGGAKMDTATMLEEAARYVRFLKRQIRLLQANPNQAVLSTAVNNNTSFTAVAGPSYNMFGGNYKFDDGANNQSADDLTCLNNKFIAGQYY